MQIFSNLNYYIFKIKKNGFRWLLLRIKYEFLAPTFKLTFFILKIYQRTKSLFISKKNNYKLFNDDTLVVVYDLSFQAITFDVAFFLVHAETYAIKNNKKQMHVIIIKEKKGGLIEKNYDSVIDYSNRIWRTKEIIISMVQLHHFTTGYTFLDNISNLDKYISNSLVYPKDYKSFNPPIKYKDFIGSRTIGMEMPKYKSFEIDDKIDFMIYKNLIKL